VLQSEYSLWERNLEERIIPVIRELGIGLVPFAPLGRGFLAGATKRAEEYPPTDWRYNDPRFQGENFDRNMQAASVVRDIAATHQATPAQVAIAWLLHKGDDIVPIPGTKRRVYLESNAAAADLAITKRELAELNEMFPAGAAAGDRYPPELMKTVDRG
jgi:aryl-alcohol dehydrogenase-like predicted oxidoreductase